MATSADRRRVHVEWANRVRAEYTSAALAAQALHWGIQCGLPDGLLRTAIRIVGDELDHDSPDGWRQVDPNTIELQGAACERVQAGGTHTVTAAFDCWIDPV